MPKVSIIMPVYNAEKYLRRSLDSAVRQTLTDIEIICVNDASTDNSLQILKQASLIDQRIIILEHSLNKGEGVTRNTGLNIATGEYISFLDADDALSLNFCEKLYDKSIGIKPDLILGTSLRKQGEKNTVIEENRFAYENKNILFFTSYFCSAIYKRDVIDKNNIRYTPNLPLSADLLFVNEFLLHARTFSYDGEAKYIYFRRNDSMNGLVLSDEKIDSALFVFNKMVENFNLNPEIIANQKGYEFYCSYMFFNYLNIIFKNNNSSKRIEAATNLLEILNKIKYKAMLLERLKREYPLLYNFLLLKDDKMVVSLFEMSKKEFMIKNLRYKITKKS